MPRRSQIADRRSPIALHFIDSDSAPAAFGATAPWGEVRWDTVRGKLSNLTEWRYRCDVFKHLRCSGSAPAPVNWLSRVYAIRDTECNAQAEGGVRVAKAACIWNGGRGGEKRIMDGQSWWFVDCEQSGRGRKKEETAFIKILEMLLIVVVLDNKYYFLGILGNLRLL